MRSLDSSNIFLPMPMAAALSAARWAMILSFSAIRPDKISVSGGANAPGPPAMFAPDIRDSPVCGSVTMGPMGETAGYRPPLPPLEGPRPPLPLTDPSG